MSRRSSLPLSVLAITVLTIAVLASGCRSTAPVETRVSVNLEAVVRRAMASSPRVEAPASPSAPAPLPPASRTLRAVPARAAGDSRRDPEKLQARLRTEIARAQTRLTERLREIYAFEADGIGFARDREIEELRQAGLADIVAKIRGRFDLYAAERAPLVAQLAFLAGFPDPGPLVTVGEPDEWTKRRAAEAAELRKTIAALDATFDAYVVSLQEGAAAELVAKIRTVRGDLARLRRESDARAEREAREQIRTTGATLDLRLAKLAAPKLPAVAARTQTLPGSRPIPEARVTSIRPLGPDRASIEARVRAEVRIWSGLNGLTVVRPEAAARDATEEFEKWRKLG